jgi:F-type H+-transporting ATPase subunit delta
VSQVELAKRYAKALLQLGHQKKMAKEYATQLKAVSDIIFGDKEVSDFFANTTVSHDLKKKSLETLFQNNNYAEDVRAFLYLLVDRSRMYALASITLATSNILDEEEGVTRGKIKSSSPISEQTKAEFEKKIGAALGKKIYLDASIDEKIMGGARIEVGGWTFDDSLETHLNHLGDQLLKSKK